jgi:predicted nuclease of restriction endonuclease-like (RecB) superfamily
MSETPAIYANAIREIKSAILRSRYRAATLANRELLLLYFSVGGYISANSRKGKWGTNAIETISAQLQKELPGLRGFSATNMKNMRLFHEEWAPYIQLSEQLDSGHVEIRQLPTADKFPDALSHRKTNRQLPTAELDYTAFFRVGFTQHREILRHCPSREERLFYIARCAAEFWSVEALKSNLRGNLFVRTGAMPNNFITTLSETEQARRAIRSFKDEYLLDFINIEDENDPDERLVEQGIVANIKQFLLSFGNKFCFMGNQYRVEVGGKEFFIDLLFFHRELHCLVAVELKRGEFKPAHLGQLNFYLSTLDEQVRQADELPSIGILLCKEANRSVVEIAVRDYTKPLGVATYRTRNEMPERWQKALPDLEEMKRVLSETQNDKEDKV